MPGRRGGARRLPDDLKTLAATIAGRPLYSWQERLLADYLSQGQVPDAVDIPTGLGKTTVISLWLAALARGAALPRRLVYVVDRRAVVDQATTEADRIAMLLGTGDGGGTQIEAIRERLRLPGGHPLPVSTLRGQHIDNHRWLEHPGLPAIIVGTVDMIGSRLLFSGYTVSRRMRPVHAGLLAVDALVVLDEAHLVPPFERLVRQIQQFRRTEAAGISFPALRVISLSATGRTFGEAFRLNETDLHDPRVTARLDAAKRLRLEPEVSLKELPDALADRVWDLAQPSSAVVVYCDRRRAAKDVADLLRERVREAYGQDADRVALLVGERRVHERARLAESPAFERFVASAQRNQQYAGPAFLVATSAGEVGVDLDADHMVCDLVQWERMVQRLGRVNRRPSSDHVGQVIVIPAQAAMRKEEADAEIDAERLKTLTAPFQTADWPSDATGAKDASTRTLHGLKQNPAIRSILEAASSPEPLSPELTLPLAHALSMTSLREHSGRPEVPPWIRGWVDELPQTRALWRRRLPLRDDLGQRKELDAFLEEAPPHLSEIVEASTSALVTLLRKRAAAWLDGRKNRSEEAAAAADAPRHPALIVALDSDGGIHDIWSAERIVRSKADHLERLLNGRTVIIDARLGGLDAEGLLDPRANDAPETLDIPATRWPEEHETGFRVRVVPITESDSDWRPVFRWELDPDSEDENRLELRVEVWRAGSALHGDPAVSRTPQELEAHVQDVINAVAETAGQLRLSDPFPVLLKGIAEVHDSGKSRLLWQQAMGAPRDGKVYAKTDGRSNPRLLQIDGETYRHEFGSLRDAIDTGAFARLDVLFHDLALHIVASHHGQARPVIAPVDPDRPPSLGLPLAREAALRFDRLNRVLGPWELAWLEALFRAADWKASAAQQKKGRR